MATLVRVDNGETIRLLPNHLFGRLGPVSTLVEDNRVSRRHASVHWNGRAWILRDLGSNNGTYLDGRKLTPGENAAIGPGHVIRFGAPEQSFRVADVQPAVIVVQSERGETLWGSTTELEVPDRFGIERAVDRAGATPVAGWVLSDHAGDGVVRFIRDGERVVMEHDSWLVHLPEWGAELDTESVGRTIDYVEEAPSVLDAELEVQVTSNWEYIRGTLRLPNRQIDLGELSYMELVHLLARARLADLAEGAEEPGWVRVEELAHNLRWVKRRLNVEVWRVRDATVKAGLLDGQEIIQRRVSSGEIRLGVPRIVVRTV